MSQMKYENPSDSFDWEAEACYLECTNKHLETQLRHAIKAFNEIPNKRLRAVEGFEDTYALVSHLEKCLNDLDC